MRHNQVKEREAARKKRKRKREREKSKMRAEIRWEQRCVGVCLSDEGRRKA